MIKKLIIFFLLLVTSFIVVGQQHAFEIRVVQKGPRAIAVEMRAVAAVVPGANDYITDIVFGLKWNNNLNLDLSNAIVTNYNIKKAGTRSAKNTRHFQAFYSDPVGFNPAAAWQATGWVEIMAIDNLHGAGLVVFEVCEPGFDVTTDPNFGLNFTDYTPMISGSSVNIPLAVSFISFDAFIAKEHVLLLWNTGFEVNSKEFLVQRSLTGNNFETIGKLPAAGNSTTLKTYEYKDEKARKEHKGKNVFYRIAEMSNDGRIEYTGIKKVFIPNTKNNLKLAYDAAGKEAILFYECQQSDDVVISVFDMKGSLVLRKKANVAGGSNQIDLPAHNLADGVYKIELKGKHDSQEISMVKQ